MNRTLCVSIAAFCVGVQALSPTDVSAQQATVTEDEHQAGAESVRPAEAEGTETPATGASEPATATEADGVEANTSQATEAPVTEVPATQNEPVQAPTEEAPPAHQTVEAEWGRGVTFRSDDDDFTLQIRGRLQVLGQAAIESGADPDLSMQVRRARLVFLGNLGSSQLQYYVQLGLAPRDMESDLLIPLRDAQLTWNAHRDLAIRVGQMKVPFNRERVISSSALQMVDRSIVNAELTLDRDIGVQLLSNDLFGLDGRLGYQVGVFQGNGRLRLNEGPGLLYVARVQVQPFGRFDDGYTEVDFTREERLRLSIGVGAAFNHQAQRNRSTTGTFYQLEGFDYAHGELDVHLKYGGFSLLAEGIIRSATGASERTGMVAGQSLTERAANGIGWMLQMGYLLSAVPLEFAARFSEIRPLGTSSMRIAHEALLGLNWYPLEHNLKLQIDGGVLFGDSLNQPEVVLRAQTQAYF